VLVDLVAIAEEVKHLQDPQLPSPRRHPREKSGELIENVSERLLAWRPRVRGELVMVAAATTTAPPSVVGS
jgi:hypothetical protein